MVASTPTTVPLMTVPFFNSMVTISRLSFCKNLTSFIFGYEVMDFLCFYSVKQGFCAYGAGVMGKDTMWWSGGGLWPWHGASGIGVQLMVAQIPPPIDVQTIQNRSGWKDERINSDTLHV